ncbi:hypothetical protein K4F52_004983 [Lecanicillium sp. MT-2017a]|nr:hypothetical protein K4F52_004983 [Lecanicillium sp. MT-2017a]
MLQQSVLCMLAFGLAVLGMPIGDAPESNNLLFRGGMFPNFDVRGHAYAEEIAAADSADVLGTAA